jgi:hypothetical protein
MRALVIEFLPEDIEAMLLRREVARRRVRGFAFSVRCMRSCRPF